MRQRSLSDSGFDKYQKKTRKQQFLEEMEVIVPWRELAAAIEPYYPKPEGAGRRPVGVERMLRIHLLQHWFNLSDPAAEEALYDSQALRVFVGIDLGREPVPDETTICKFRHLMERHNLGDELFHLINTYLQENGMKVNRGTIVDASIIQAPGSTKNRDKKRDPEMGATRKGNQWYFGMKVHIGVDARSGLVHTAGVTTGRVHDAKVMDRLIREDDRAVFGDKGYVNEKKKRMGRAAGVYWAVKDKRKPGRQLSGSQRKRNKKHGAIRAKVEHVFHVMKCQFGYRKVRYRGIAKNGAQVFTLLALANLYLARRRLAAAAG